MCYLVEDTFSSDATHMIFLFVHVFVGAPDERFSLHS